MQEFRIYRANKQGNGAASKFSTRSDTSSKYPEQLLFVETAAQIGTDDDDNAKFDWRSKDNPLAKSVVMKLGVPDATAILAVIKGRMPEAKLFHQNSRGNAALTLNYYKGQLSWQISSKIDDNVVQLRHMISLAEAVALEVLLERFILLYYKWV